MSSQGHPTRKPSDRRPASASARQLKRSTQPASSMLAGGGGVAGASGLGPGMAQVFRYMRSGKLSEGMTYANELIRKHPLQVLLIGMGLRFLFSRTRLGKT